MWNTGLDDTQQQNKQTNKQTKTKNEQKQRTNNVLPNVIFACRRCRRRKIMYRAHTHTLTHTHIYTQKERKTEKHTSNSSYERRRYHTNDRQEVTSFWDDFASTGQDFNSSRYLVEDAISTSCGGLRNYTIREGVMSDARVFAKSSLISPSLFCEHSPPPILLNSANSIVTNTRAVCVVETFSIRSCFLFSLLMIERSILVSILQSRFTVNGIKS